MKHRRDLTWLGDDGLRQAAGSFLDVLDARLEALEADTADAVERLVTFRQSETSGQSDGEPVGDALAQADAIIDGAAAGEDLLRAAGEGIRLSVVGEAVCGPTLGGVLQNAAGAWLTRLLADEGPLGDAERAAVGEDRVRAAVCHLRTDHRDDGGLVWWGSRIALATSGQGGDPLGGYLSLLHTLLDLGDDVLARGGRGCGRCEPDSPVVSSVEIPPAVGEALLKLLGGAAAAGAGMGGEGEPAGDDGEAPDDVRRGYL